MAELLLALHTAAAVVVLVAVVGAWRALSRAAAGAKKAQRHGQTPPFGS